ncbi:hypothetical protein GBAR_LOCUS15772 [Geodia barretti]|uniref:Uncharacterized protein n=1 Tax=Geodia barretti TaxID=519541 RepID=A0AA35WSS6_GEOBA|nr:hypothetical protein GBAR_LOCUS15772 [Geodia barretti]
MNLTAYDVLSNADKRKQYDRFGAQGASQEGSPFDFDAFFRPEGDSGFHHHTHFNFHTMFEDVFHEDDFFHNSFGGEFFQGHHPHQHTEHGDGFFGHDMDHRRDDDDDLFGGAFGGDFFNGGFDMHMEFGHTSQNCKTVTKRVGNTVTTTTTCS